MKNENFNDLKNQMTKLENQLEILVFNLKDLLSNHIVNYLTKDIQETIAKAPNNDNKKSINVRQYL
jgi:hypothetical protein